jgi:hypothetical protein
MSAKHPAIVHGVFAACLARFLFGEPRRGRGPDPSHKLWQPAAGRQLQSPRQQRLLMRGYSWLISVLCLPNCRLLAMSNSTMLMSQAGYRHDRSWPANGSCSAKRSHQGFRQA